jgi:hypothetical protein
VTNYTSFGGTLWNALCPTLTTPLANSTLTSAIVVNQNGFAISIGDTLTLTNPSTNATQTCIAAANLAANTTGPTSLAVTPFTTTSAFPVGSWVYDSAWPPCTPAQLASAMGWLVAQSGLQGLRWEILNEPDGGNGWPNSGVPALEYVQMMKLVYAAMKAADPTCIVHGFCLESLSPTGLGLGDGLTWMGQCYTAGAAQGVTHDCVSFHAYSETVGFTSNDSPPDAIGGYGMTYAQLIGNARAFMLTNGDSSQMWCTEFSWQWQGNATATTARQAQFAQDCLVRLSGTDPINNVLYSSYLKGMMWYCVTSQGGANYALYPTDSTPNPAVAVLAQVVSGVA